MKAMKRPLLVCLAIVLLSTQPHFASALTDVGAQKVFYVYVPAVGAPVNIDILGIQDNTKVWVLNITGGEGKVLASATIKRMDDYVVPNVRGENYLKIVSDKPVLAQMGASSTSLLNGRTFSGSAFYSSVSGGFVGREFILKTFDSYVSHNVFGVESGKVTVRDASDNVAQEFDISSQGLKIIDLTPSKLYRITSTGDITISTFSEDGFTALPSLAGDLVGKSFYGRVFGPPEGYSGTFVVYAYSDAMVGVRNITGSQLYSKQLKAGEYWYEEIVNSTQDLIFDSTGDISVWSGDVGRATPILLGISALGDDVTYAGGIDGKEFWFYVPARQGDSPGAVIFAWKDTTVTVNGTSHSLTADGYLGLKEGYYHVEADNTVIAQIAGEGNVFKSISSALVSPADATADVSNLPAPGGTGGAGGVSGGLETSYLLYGGVAAAVVAAVLVLVLLKRRK